VVVDKERVEGGLRKATGKIKEKVGQLTGDRDTVAEGKAEQVVGKVQNRIGKAEDAVKRGL